jgi:hypothetical protein
MAQVGPHKETSWSGLCFAPLSWLEMMPSRPAHLVSLSCLYFRCLAVSLLVLGTVYFVLGEGIVLCVGGKTGKGTSSGLDSDCIRIGSVDMNLNPDPVRPKGFPKTERALWRTEGFSWSLNVFN